MLTYIYIDVDECWVIYSMSQLQMSFKYANIEQNAFSWRVVESHVNVSFKMVGVHITLLLPYSINNDRHSSI